jgi:hypothetical protein
MYANNTSIYHKRNIKAIPLSVEAHHTYEASRLPQILHNLFTDDGEIVSFAPRLPLHPRKIQCTQFTPTTLATMDYTNFTVSEMNINSCSTNKWLLVR